MNEAIPSPLRLRHPESTDGANIHDLVALCPPLDPNSLYCNLLQASHFRATSCVAERDGALFGFVTGHRIPDRPSTQFVWQVAVAEAGRGQRLGLRMILWLLAQQPGVDHLESTITRDNTPSWRLFTAVARSLETSMNERELFERDVHFRGCHDSEVLVRIGPFTHAAAAAALQLAEPEPA